MVVDNGVNMDAILTCTAAGWVSVMWHANTGVSGIKGQGANIIIGYVTAAGVANLYDFSNAVGAGDSAHYDDTNASRFNPVGVNNIISYTGTQVGTVTEFKFKYPLNTGDVRDVPLVVGQNYNFALAWASSDNTTSEHSNYCVIKNTPF